MYPLFHKVKLECISIISRQLLRTTYKEKPIFINKTSPYCFTKQICIFDLWIIKKPQSWGQKVSDSWKKRLNVGTSAVLKQWGQRKRKMVEVWWGWSGGQVKRGKTVYLWSSSLAHCTHILSSVCGIIWLFALKDSEWSFRKTVL